MTKIEDLLELLAKHGGNIISSNELHPDLIMQAVASKRMYVDNNSLGYVWEPPFAGRFPENEKEIKLFDLFYPIPIELPEKLKDSSWLFGHCKGAKCTIKNCKVCKNEMY